MSADDFDNDIVAKLRRFHAAPALARLGSLALAHMLGAHEAGLQHHSFCSIDATDNGAITPQELTSALARWGCEVPSDIDELVRKADMNRGNDMGRVLGSGYCRCKFYLYLHQVSPIELIFIIRLASGGDLSLVEFVSATMDREVYHSTQLCRAAFKIIDADNDGHITVPDIEAFLDHGHDLDDDMKGSYAKAAASIMQAPISAYGTDKINADQFTDMMSKLAE